MRLRFTFALCFFPWFYLTGDTFARNLTFEDRVKAQEAIERVYYSHQIGATKPFEEAIPRAVLENKVRTYLKQSVALDTLWATPVTGELLRRELERMAQKTRMPERLREIYEVLGKDPFLIQESLARPALVDRLVRNFFAYDRTVHAKMHQEAESLRQDLIHNRLNPRFEHPARTVVDLVRVVAVKGTRGFEEHERSLAGRKDDPSSLELRPEAFDRYRAQLPERVGEIGAVQEEREAFVIRVVLDRTEDEIKVATFILQKLTWDEWWVSVEGRLDEASVDSGVLAADSLPLPDSGGSEVLSDTTCLANDTWDNGSLDALPAPRYAHTSVWTGSLMMVWGGYDGSNLNTGGRYDPATDTWTPTSTINAPSGRSNHTAIWTGSVMVVWGGFGGSYVNSGGRYDPATDTWTPTSTNNAPSGRAFSTAVWTGSLMVVWGGYVGSYLNTGGRYNPANDTWTPTSTTNAPSARYKQIAVWTGRVMVLWGGFGGSYLNTGGQYDPATDTWTPTSTTNAPSGRYDHAAVWTGSHMVVWGGSDGSYLNTGGRYDPATDTWTPTSMANAPAGRRVHTAVWTGSLMVVWGGSGPGGLVNTGGRYDPGTDTWTPTSMTNAPSGRYNHTAVWTGSLMVIWGGLDGSNLNTGGRYDPTTDAWTPTSTTNAPSARVYHTAVWTGSVMVVWGGYDYSAVLSTGGRYDPARDTWTPTSMTNPPSGRLGHTAVWTGSRMVVWGGSDNSGSVNTGGRYDPSTDTWAPTSTTNAPPGRSLHTAVWTGSRMVVWGGESNFLRLNTGGLYDPAADAWSPTTMTGAPSGRDGNTAVWTGSVMVVWGGYDGSSLINTGGRYDPARDTWTPTSMTDAPSGRYNHSAVWTGSLMVVWGGYGGSDFDTGGRYNPATDTWTPSSTTNAPSGRTDHTAVWTGSFMVIWGGYAGSELATGGRYNPVTDSWIPTSANNAPPGRFSHTAVWTGSSMIVWGGRSVPLALRSGGRYILSEEHDGDGFTECQGDCNDNDPTIHPGATEVCDGLDNNCDGQVDESFDLGRACTADVDACHQVAGTQVCRSDGMGTECSGRIVFHDTTPPQAALSITPTVLWPPNHRMVPVRVEWIVTDACDPSPQVTLISATSSEPDDAPGNGDGNTTGDIQDSSVGTPDTSVLLRAERSGDGPGRVYTLTYAARDASGNTASTLEIVRVPHDEGSGPEPVTMSLEGDGTPGMAHLYWNAVNGAEMYDVIQGDLSQVSVSDGEIRLGPVHVLASGQTGASYSEGPSGAIPTVGSAFFYLVQYRQGQNVSGWGTESSPWPAEPTSCDIGCPGEPVSTAVASMYRPLK